MQQVPQSVHFFACSSQMGSSNASSRALRSKDTLSFVAWLKQEDEFVQQGEPLYVVETDKAMLDVEAPATGGEAGGDRPWGALDP